ncbi:hypothetical protein ACOBR2_19240 [Telmatobacter bradus]|uniref:hypothetical protein n=1 Tax=Telmatobacter bradus TaxID=474953 RepID=UPI003B437521
MNKRTLHVAFATKNRERISGGLEDAERLALYVVDAEDVVSGGVLCFDSTTAQKKKCADRQRIAPGYTRCGGKKLVDSAPEDREIQARVQALQQASVRVLVVQSSLHGLTALELKKVGIFPVCVDKQEFIGAVLARLQEMLRMDTPLWMEHRVETVSANLIEGFSF